MGFEEICYESNTATDFQYGINVRIGSTCKYQETERKPNKNKNKTKQKQQCIQFPEWFAVQ